MTAKQETYLEQPEYSDFINTMIEQCGDDPTNYHMFTTLYLMELVDSEGRPTELAGLMNLPYNKELVKLIAQVAVCKEAEEFRADWLDHARYQMVKQDPHSATTIELENEIRQVANDITSWKADRLEALNKALDIINK